ncbi:ATP-binding protein [Streptomyces sp. bgisy100]|uniref:ATP-binding protein n=1 Tax=Streptomyces sp. bgisy100 TaxID=3413783 RepID=UPI003D749D2E
MPAAHRGPPHRAPGYSATLPREPGSAAIARRLVHVALAAWRLEELDEAAALIVSELVTNSVRHARSNSIRITVTRPEMMRVRIGVVDKSQQFPVPRESSAEDEGGRGLTLVETLSEGWGTDPLPWGKRVWAELRGKGHEGGV